MSNVTIKNINVPRTARNGRIYLKGTVNKNTNTANNSNLFFENGVKIVGSVVSWSGLYEGLTKLDGNLYYKNPEGELILDEEENPILIENLKTLEVKGNTIIEGALSDWDSILLDYKPNTKALTVKGNLHVEGNITATKDVIAYFTTTVSDDVLNLLSVSQPLFKSGSNIGLLLSNQFELINGELSIKSSVLNTGITSVSWTDIVNKPTFSTVATSGSYTDLINKPTFTSTIAGATDYSSYFNSSKKALNAVSADTAYSVAWYNITVKPNFSVVATTGSYNDLLNKPALFSGAYSALSGIPSTFTPSAHSLSSHSDFTTYFSGTKALVASVADSVSWTNISSKPTFATVATSGSYTDLINKPTLSTVATSGSYTDLINKPVFTSTIAGATDFSTYFTNLKANSAIVADSVSWLNITGKPTFSTVATSGNYLDLTNRPTLFSGNYTDLINKPTIYSTIAGLTDVNSYFTGTKAHSAATADSANSVNWSNVNSKPTLLSQFINDLGNYGGFALQSSISNINNTSDANKPVSIAQQAALDLKANINNPTFTGTVTGITKSMVGLGNVTNESKDSMFTDSVLTGITKVSNLTFNSTTQTIKQLVWSRIIDLNENNTLGTSFIVNISGTRTSLIWNITAQITTTSTGYGFITILNSGGYSQAKLRLVTTSNGGGFLEIYDNVTGAVYGATESINLTIENFVGNSVILTTFQDGTTTTGYTVQPEINTISGGISTQGIISATNKFELKNQTGATVWSVSINGTDLMFSNSSGVNKCKLDQNGNIYVVGEVTAFASF